jgi:hypothetical protein
MQWRINDMRNAARLPAADRRALFTNASSKAGMTVAIIEKDFWVCWTLDYLFHRCKWSRELAFKGGTSLSKAFQLIERFSEDIDLILDWRVLGYGAEEPWEQRSKTKQDQFNKEAGKRTVDFLRNEFIPRVKADMAAELGIAIVVETDDADGQTVLFTYPQEFSDQALMQEIRLEIGTLAVWSPSAHKEIKPYAAEYYGHLFSAPSTSILTVLPERTFWEKATILHHEANRPTGSIMPQRYSRHYYDMFCMFKSWVKDSAFADLDLLRQVVEFKSKFYPRPWARYDDAKPGSLKLTPPKHCLKDLEEDYGHMMGMIFGKKPGFRELLEGIQALEIEINSLT